MKKIKQNVATYWVAYALYRPSMWTFIKRRRMEIHARHWVGYIEGVHELYKLEQDLAAWYDKGTTIKILGIQKLNDIIS